MLFRTDGGGNLLHIKSLNSFLLLFAIVRRDLKRVLVCLNILTLSLRSRSEKFCGGFGRTGGCHHKVAKSVKSCKACLDNLLGRPEHSAKSGEDGALRAKNSAGGRR